MYVTQEDKNYIKKRYDLTYDQVFNAVKLSYRSTMSLCAAAKAIKIKSTKGGAE